MVPGIELFFGKSKFEKPKIKTKTKTETKRVKRPTGRALRAPLAGSPAFVSVFVFVSIFDFSKFNFSKYFRYRLINGRVAVIVLDELDRPDNHARVWHDQPEIMLGSSMVSLFLFSKSC